MKKEKVPKLEFMYATDVCFIDENSEHERFSSVLDQLKHFDIIKSYKEFADNINETSVGLNDIKKGRKKLSVNHVKNINTKYPFINTDFIIFNEGRPFYDDFLISYHCDDFERCYYQFDLEKIRECMSNTNNSIENNDTEKKSVYKNEKNNLIKELLLTKNELLKAKDEIIKLQSQIYDLKSKQSK